MSLTNKHIYDFIVALPGGNVGQYSRLLCMSPQRLNAFLSDDKLGKRLIKQKLVKGPMKGRMPSWAGHFTERGVLTANDVNLSANGALQRVLKTLPQQYRPDAEHMFRMLIQMSSGNLLFEDGLSEITGPYVHLAGEHASQQGELLALKELNAEMRETVSLLREARALTDSSNLLRLAAPQEKATQEKATQDA